MRRREGIVNPDEIARRGEELEKQLEEQAEDKDIDEVEKQLDCIEDEVQWLNFERKNQDNYL